MNPIVIHPIVIHPIVMHPIVIHPIVMHPIVIHPTVSIITITQYGRYESFKILFNMIQAQTYQNIIQWTIIEGSKTIVDCEKNMELICGFIKNKFNTSITIIPFPTKPIGELRNYGNHKCIGDIIVCMDDDDYYPPTRVYHAVEQLMRPSNLPYLIAGSSVLYIYDFFLGKLYKYDSEGIFGPYHSTNNCMAFTREYLQNNQHDNTAIHAEECSFTKNFTNEMVELDPLQTIICISHSSNTFNKRNLCIGGSLGLFQYMKEIDEPITNYISPDIYNMMKDIYYKNASDGPFTIESLVKTNNENVHFLEKYMKDDFELKCRIRNIIQNEV